MDKYEATIGIECHVQLATKSKLFSRADNDARDKDPNTVVSPIDYGLPGMLPILNKESVRLAARAAAAMSCDVAKVSRFDRKHYFYPDLPSGYQITQMYQPTILSGIVDAPLTDGETVRVRIHHAHLETDAGKLTHYKGHSLVDLNRAGTPLIEIVTEPDMHSPEQARAFATELYRLMTYAGVTRGDLYHGNMRFDVNISIAEKGSTKLGTRAEIKNLNSFRSIERAAEYEFKRQVELLEKGEKVVQETRGFDDAKQKTFSQRSKEDAVDYRYMPDPDIPPVVLSETEIADMQQNMPMLPPAFREKWQSMGLDKSVVNTILATQGYAEVVTKIQDEAGDAIAKKVAHWFTSSLEKKDDDEAIAEYGDLSTGKFIELARMVEAGELSSTNAKEIFPMLLVSDEKPREIATRKKLIQVSNEDEVAKIVDEVLADPASQKAINDFLSGNEKAIGFIVGQVMKKSKGQANPSMAQKLIKERIS